MSVNSNLYEMILVRNMKSVVEEMHANTWKQGKQLIGEMR